MECQVSAKKTSLIYSVVLFVITVLFLAGCASHQIELQKKQRNRFAEETGFYCEFVNGESVPAIDLDLNLKMAKKCDREHNFTVTSYVQPNEQRGLIFCCILAKEDFKDEQPKSAEPSKVDLNKAKNVGSSPVDKPQNDLERLINFENNAVAEPKQPQQPKGN
jgi:hypothetical protein